MEKIKSSWYRIAFETKMLFEEIADLSFDYETDVDNLDAPYRALRDENQIHGDDAGYQYLADWITE
jgi:hypothetical protein